VMTNEDSLQTGNNARKTLRKDPSYLLIFEKKML
jgi:hypothetical protein